MENEIVDIDTPTDDGASDTETTDNSVEDNQPDDLEKKNKQLFERAKKAEAEAKELKQKLADAAIKKPNEIPVGLSREEAILIAKGVSETVINEASVIAKAKGISLGDAMKDPLIEAYSQKLKADEKREKAQLGASKGSGKNSGVDLINAVGMTEEEHRKAIGM